MKSICELSQCDRDRQTVNKWLSILSSKIIQNWNIFYLNDQLNKRNKLIHLLNIEIMKNRNIVNFPQF